MLVAAKLGAQSAPTCLPRVGVSRLRRFLERRVEECYRRNVARIVPLLQQEMSKAEGRLLTTEQEVGGVVCVCVRVAAVGHSFVLLGASALCWRSSLVWRRADELVRVFAFFRLWCGAVFLDPAEQGWSFRQGQGKGWGQGAVFLKLFVIYPAE